MENRVGLIGAFAFALASSAAVVAADQKMNGESMQGDRLFQFHGCVNCHGEKGKNPVSMKVPQLGGKDADYILVESTRILKGEKGTDEAKMMHSAVAYQSSCDAPPTDEEMQKIAEWLAAQ